MPNTIPGDEISKRDIPLRDVTPSLSTPKNTIFDIINPRCYKGIRRSKERSKTVKRQLSALLGAAIVALGLAACGPPEPIRIGLIAGLSDRGSDFGESVRNGVILAVEQQNQAGGIKGRKIELIVRDDGQNPEQAGKAARE